MLTRATSHWPTTKGAAGNGLVALDCLEQRAPAALTRRRERAVVPLLDLLGERGRPRPILTLVKAGRGCGLHSRDGGRLCPDCGQIGAKLAAELGL